MPRDRRRGVTTLELLVCTAILALLCGLLLSAAQRVREAANRAQCANRLRELGVALQNYHAGHAALPPGISSDAAGVQYPFMSWLTRLLPYLEQGALWEQTTSAYRQEKTFWIDPPHVGLGRVMPAFLCPSDGRAGAARNLSVTGGPCAFTSYLGVEGANAGLADGLLYLDSKHRLTDVTDGASNTLLIGERPPSADFALGWWYAGWGQRKNGDGDMLLGVRTRNYSGSGAGCPEGPYHFAAGAFSQQCDVFHFWSPHGGGAFFAFADGSVRFLRYSVDPVMPALASRAAGDDASYPE